MVSELKIRVYYEDTDSGGVVYYANYFKFAERGRTEILREKEILQTDLYQNQGILFVVREANIDLKSPAKLDDLIIVKTTIEKVQGAKIIFLQELSVDNQIISVIRSVVVAVNSKFRPIRVPDFIKAKFL